VESEAAPARKALEPVAQPEPYDVEATLRAVRELDLAVKSSGSVRQFLENVSRGDYRRVAPKLLESRKRIVDVLVKYYGALDKQKQEEELWGSFGRLSDELARVLQATDIRAMTPLGTVSLNPSDPARQKVLAEERAKREASRAATFAEVQRFEEELLYALDAAVPVFREVEDEWMRLCAQRDRVYLQVAARDYADAAQSARTALELAPGDVEATLLLALALIERDREKPSGERTNEVETLLADVLQREPDNAPALVLRGMWRWIRGEASEGRSDLELAASRYPLQADRLRDELDPYSKREYLRRTRQGGRVTALYRTMMLGANHFSPDLQLARAQLDAGDAAGAFERVKDHFARRRVQGQWDLVLYDLEFCEELLGDRYREYVPEKSYLDLEVEEQLIGSEINVTVNNRSDRALRDAALVLAVRFTDMVEGEYTTFTVGKTQPEIAPLARTKFGSVEVSYSGLGELKEFGDAVKPLRAVLICDDGVFFIDTIEHKSELARAAEPTPHAPGQPRGTVARFRAHAVARKPLDRPREEPRFQRQPRDRAAPASSCCSGRSSISTSARSPSTRRAATASSTASKAASCACASIRSARRSTAIPERCGSSPRARWATSPSCSAATRPETTCSAASSSLSAPAPRSLLSPP
jgi:hypothetical protein